MLLPFLHDLGLLWLNSSQVCCVCAGFSNRSFREQTGPPDLLETSHFLYGMNHHQWCGGWHWPLDKDLMSPRRQTFLCVSVRELLAWVHWTYVCTWAGACVSHSVCKSHTERKVAGTGSLLPPCGTRDPTQAWRQEPFSAEPSHQPWVVL